MTSKENAMTDDYPIPYDGPVYVGPEGDEPELVDAPLPEGRADGRATDPKTTRITEAQQETLQSSVFCIRCRTGAQTYGDLCIDGRRALGLDPFTLAPVVAVPEAGERVCPECGADDAHCIHRTAPAVPVGVQREAHHQTPEQAIEILMAERTEILRICDEAGIGMPSTFHGAFGDDAVDRVRRLAAKCAVAETQWRRWSRPESAS